MPNEESDVPELCTEPFTSCLSTPAGFASLTTGSNADRFSSDLREFMRKCHYGTATLTHLATYGWVNWYITEEHPDYIWRQEIKGGYPQPLRWNLRSNMTDRFWEIVIQHQAAREETLKEREEKRKLQAAGLPTNPLVITLRK